MSETPTTNIAQMMGELLEQFRTIASQQAAGLHAASDALTSHRKDDGCDAPEILDVIRLIDAHEAQLITLKLALDKLLEKG